MSYENRYEGYKWVKTKKYKVITIDDERFVPEDHHISETKFLISEIRKLAKLLDEMNPVS